MSQDKNQLSPTGSHSPSVEHQTTSPPQANQPRDKNEHVIPWDERARGVHVRCFAGYDLKFNGWIRRDVLERRQQEEEQRHSAQGPADDDDDDDEL